jgi:hypothetical protein
MFDNKQVKATDAKAAIHLHDLLQDIWYSFQEPEDEPVGEEDG